MCYMTRQLFPSPSQGALICAGAGEEGRLAAAPASVAAARQDPISHSGVWPHGFCALLRGFCTLLGILLMQAGLNLRRETGACLSVLGTALIGVWGVLCCRLARVSTLHPGRARVRVGAAGRRLSGEREGDRT